MSDMVLIALITALPPTIVGLAAFVVSLRTDRKAKVLDEKSDVIHTLVNSNLSSIKDELARFKSDLAATRADLHAARGLIVKLENHILAMTQEEGES